MEGKAANNESPHILLGKTWTVAQKPSEPKDGYKYLVGTKSTGQPSTPIYIYIFFNMLL
jgi:hypothetical protein